LGLGGKRDKGKGKVREDENANNGSRNRDGDGEDRYGDEDGNEERDKTMGNRGNYGD
jgi:hypothetical protein